MSLIDQQARTLYDAGRSVRPSWDQLGDTTKDYWRERTPAFWAARGVPAHCLDLFV